MPARPLAAVLLVLALSACSAQAGPAGTGPATAAPTAMDDGAASEEAGPGPDAITAPAAQDSAEATSPAPEPPATAPHSDPAAADVVVNKQRPLQPATFEPADLRPPDVPATSPGVLLGPDTAAAVERMFAAAREDGVGLVIASGYRSYAEQDVTYRHWLDHYGSSADADVVSARPGYSEHQTGLAFDIAQEDGSCTLVACFAGTAAAQWAAEHAAEYGIILRYPLGYHTVTGFFAEPWHFRYVGTDVALGMREAGQLTLEEYFGLPGASSY
ncbi:M15 family metallopeptidase [Arthrobacter echini]|uniref:M15 family metallopeptidase n=1 Tax=Arthrobacter echini TaxID=1529066 RepID=UPI001FE63ED7|nr:M15 family metallopeptidase [Arthrobacter echini]